MEFDQTFPFDSIALNWYKLTSMSSRSDTITIRNKSIC